MFGFEVRNGYESKRLLIEFDTLALSKFLSLWDKVLLDISAELVSTEDVWQNDECIRRYNSPIGKFLLTISNGDLSFIMANDFEQENDDNSVILAVAEALEKSGQFSKLSVFEK